MRSKENKRGKEARRRGIYILPNLFTSASLFGGFYAIIASIQGRYEAAAAAILVSCLFDALDGKIARFTNTTSQFGTEYDSLSDLVAFGIAPGILTFQWALAPFGRLGWIACFTYVICGALRLARFNVQKSVVEARYFKGLPIPGAAMFIASLVLFTTALGGFPESKKFLVIGVVYFLSFLMVSTVRYPSFKEFHLRKQRPFNVLVAVILMFLVIAYMPKIMLFLVLVVYILSGIVVSANRFRRKRLAKSHLKGTAPAEGREDLEGANSEGVAP